MLLRLSPIYKHTINIKEYNNFLKINTMINNDNKTNTKINKLPF